LIIELDGSGHFEENQMAYDKIRTDFLESLSLSVLRFTNTEVLTSTRSVLDCIYQQVKKRLS
jgi:very-short-patch-repair endonuclease